MKRSELREIIREIISEIEFKSQEDFDDYKTKHKMRSTTKVNIGGKETTVGKASIKAEPKTSGTVDWSSVLKKSRAGTGRRGIPGEISKKYTNYHLKKAGFSDTDIEKYTKASLTSGGAKKFSQKAKKEFAKFKRQKDKIGKQMWVDLKKK